MRPGPLIFPVLAGLALAAPAVAAPADLAPLFATIKSVGPEGKGNADAAKAWKQITQQGIDALLPTLAACDDADPVAVNWLLSAAEAVAEREFQSRKTLPADKLDAFIKDTKHKGPARRLAYELLDKVDPRAAESLLAKMLDDPAPELRRDALAKAIDAAKTQDKATARKTLLEVFPRTRDRDQVDAVAKKLKELGETVDLASHYGFVRDWLVTAPFDNVGGKGFHVAFAPEKGVDVSAVYKGKDGAEARWSAQTTADPYGMVDLNKMIGKLKGTTAYAYAVVEAERDMPVQVRVGCINSVKVVVNGKELLNREECHHGMQMDQHVLPAALKKGRNEILLKVSQNEQTEPWAQDWKFQLRLTDAAGGAVSVKNRTTEAQRHGEDKKEEKK